MSKDTARAILLDGVTIRRCRRCGKLDLYFGRSKFCDQCKKERKAEKDRIRRAMK